MSNMKHAAVFSIVTQQSEPEPRIELIREDTGAKITLDAATLVAQYELASGDILLILDEDCPYEEQMHLALIRDGEVLDHIVIGAPYATGSFREVGIGGDSLRFQFSGQDVFTVSAQEKGSRMPQRLPSGARRRGSWLAPHHLSLAAEEAAST